jgi:hypothetical protein
MSNRVVSIRRINNRLPTSTSPRILTPVSPNCFVPNSIKLTLSDSLPPFVITHYINYSFDANSFILSTSACNLALISSTGTLLGFFVIVIFTSSVPGTGWNSNSTPSPCGEATSPGVLAVCGRTWSICASCLVSSSWSVRGTVRVNDCDWF